MLPGFFPGGAMSGGSAMTYLGSSTIASLTSDRFFTNINTQHVYALTMLYSTNNSTVFTSGKLDQDGSNLGDMTMINSHATALGGGTYYLAIWKSDAVITFTDGGSGFNFIFTANKGISNMYVASYALGYDTLEDTGSASGGGGVGAVTAGVANPSPGGVILGIGWCPSGFGGGTATYTDVAGAGALKQSGVAFTGSNIATISAQADPVVGDVDVELDCVGSAGSVFGFEMAQILASIS